MDSLQLQQFSEGVQIGFYSLLPVFGSVLVVGVAVYLVKKFLRL